MSSIDISTIVEVSPSDNIIVIVSDEIQVEVSAGDEVLVVANEGLQGPIGPQGPTGPSGPNLITDETTISVLPETAEAEKRFIVDDGTPFVWTATGFGSDLLKLADATELSTQLGLGGAAFQNAVNPGEGIGLPLLDGAGFLSLDFLNTSTAVQGDVLTYVGAYWQPTAPNVASVFGRTGNIAAQSGDYTAAQVTNAAAINATNIFSTTQTIRMSVADTSALVLQRPNGSTLLSFEMFATDRQRIRIGSTASEQGLSFVNAAGAEILRLQDNGVVLTSSFGTPGGLSFADYFVRRGNFNQVFFGDSGNAGVLANSAIFGGGFSHSFRADSMNNAIPVITARGAASQTGELFRAENSAGSTLWAVRVDGSIQPASLTDAAAANNSLYVSTSVSPNRLAYKNVSGTITYL